MAKINLVTAVNQALMQEMERDEDVVLLGEDIGVNGGVFRATEGLYQKFPGRVFDTPLSELAIVGTSIGLALYGLKPVAEIQFSGFLYGAFEQIISHLGRIRMRSRGRYTSHIVIRSPYGGGIHAPEHHSESMEAIYIHTPGVKVVIPSTPYDCKGLLTASIRDPDPVIFLEPKRVYRSIKQEVPEEQFVVELGKAKVVKEGADVTVVTWGSMLKVTMDALSGIDTSVEIIDVRTLKPLDIDTIITSVKKTGRCVVIHEAPKTCGFGAEIAALINEKAILHLKAPVLRIAGWDTAFPLYKLEEYYLPNKGRILAGIDKVMKF